MHKRFVRERPAAEFLGTTPKTLQHWRYSGFGPPYSKVEGIILYDLDDLTEYVVARKRGSTSDRAGAAA